MRKLVEDRQVVYSGEPRLIVAIDADAGRVELAPRPVRDVAQARDTGGPGLHYLGGPSVPGDVVSVSDCYPRPDLSEAWPWLTI